MSQPISQRLSRKARKDANIPMVVPSDTDEDDEPVKVRCMTNKRQKVSQLSSFVRSFSRESSSLKRKLSTNAESPTPPQASIADEAYDDCDQWIDKYSPTSLQTLALHKRKFEDVREALKEMLDPRSQAKLLILSGPSGSSKSTSIQVLANELICTTPMSSNLIEWFNPSHQTSEQFQEFLAEAKYRTGKNSSIILIEELPNVFHQGTKEAFQRSLLDWVSSQRQLPPLVLCITEYDISSDENKNQSYSLDNNYTVDTILGRELVNSPGVKRIKFNPVNVTIIRKTLKEIASREKDIFKNIPLSEISAKISELSTFGDIRSAISAFQFWSQWKILDSNLSIDMGVESTMSIFHAVGKCIYGTKENEHENVTMTKVYHDYLNRSDILRLTLLENYTQYNKSTYQLENAAVLADVYSFADTLGESLGMELATRATRDTFRDIPHKISSQGPTFNFPREWKVRKVMAQCANQIHKYVEIETRRKMLNRSFIDANMIYGFYEPLINKQRAFKNKSKMAYLTHIGAKIPPELYEPHQPYIQERLGGPFREIHVDSKIVTEDSAGPMDSYFSAYAASFKDSDSDHGSEFEDDPIVDSSDNLDDTFGDDLSFEAELISFSQRKSTQLLSSSSKSASLKPTVTNISQSRNSEFYEDFNDDDFSD